MRASNSDIVKLNRCTMNTPLSCFLKSLKLQTGKNDIGKWIVCLFVTFVCLFVFFFCECLKPSRPLLTLPNVFSYLIKILLS